MKERNYVAIYKFGNDNPLGAVRNYEMAASVLKDVCSELPGKYFATPITIDEARQIRERLEEKLLQ